MNDEAATPLILGHRGASVARPENTIAAFAHALDLGAGGIECDVQRAADGALVLIHDDTLDRTTDGTGVVGDLPWSALAGLDAGGGNPIPRLADLFAWARDAGKLGSGSRSMPASQVGKPAGSPQPALVTIVFTLPSSSSPVLPVRPTWTVLLGAAKTARIGARALSNSTKISGAPEALISIVAFVASRGPIPSGRPAIASRRWRFLPIARRRPVRSARHWSCWLG